MFKDRSILVFIGARGGSKGLPNKNILNFAGKPLIHWTIRAGLDSKYADRVLVSTDSPKIAAAAKDSGADAPFIRPAELATDTAPQSKAIQHCLEWLKAQEGRIYDYVMALQPTSPLRRASHIDEAVEAYFRDRKSPEDTLVSVKAAPKKAAWLMRRRDEGYIEFCFQQDNCRLQRQRLPEFFYPNGAIYLAPAPRVLVEQGFYGPKTLFYRMPESASIDIDDRADFDRALAAFRKQSAS